MSKPQQQFAKELMNITEKIPAEADHLQKKERKIEMTTKRISKTEHRDS